MAAPRLLRIRCSTWDQVESFYLRKVRADGRLAMRVPFDAEVGTAVTLALELPNQIVMAIDGGIALIGAAGGRVEVQLHGLTPAIVAQLASLVSSARDAGEASRDVVVDDERRLVAAYETELRRMRQLRMHELLGVPRHPSARELWGAWLAIARRVHPDMVARFGWPRLTAVAEEIMALINRAYDTLRAELVTAGRGATMGAVIDNLKTVSRPTLAVEDAGAGAELPAMAGAVEISLDPSGSTLPAVERIEPPAAPERAARPSADIVARPLRDVRPMVAVAAAMTGVARPSEPPASAATAPKQGVERPSDARPATLTGVAQPSEPPASAATAPRQGVARPSDARPATLTGVAQPAIARPSTTPLAAAEPAASAPAAALATGSAPTAMLEVAPQLSSPPGRLSFEDTEPFETVTDAEPPSAPPLDELLRDVSGDRFLSQIRERLGAGDHRSAQQLAEAALHLHAGNRRLRGLQHVAMAMAACGRNDRIGAVSALETALAHDPASMEAARALETVTRAVTPTVFAMQRLFR